MLLLSVERSWIWDILRGFLSLLDWVCYHFSAILLQVIFDISNFTLDQGIFDLLIQRIYVILGIFMLFKLFISFLSYFTNPDKISDKENGLGKLSFRIIAVLIMLVMIPYFFAYLTRIQNAVITSLPRIILGVNSKSTNVETKGEKIAWSVYNAFFYDNEECTGSNITTTTFYDDNGQVIDQPEDVLGYPLKNINLSCKANSSVYQYEYTPVISTIAGGFMCYVLIGISVSVAIRMFKMVILQMIAPIPVISYIDPKSSKDGAFKNWTKTLFSTWLELFIQLGTLFLIIYILDTLLYASTSNMLSYIKTLGGLRGALFTVFVVLGLFMFAKQAPKFLLDSLGIKSKGTFSKALGLSSAVLGAPGNAIASYKASKSANESGGPLHTAGNFAKNLGAGLFGGVGGAIASGSAAANADKDQLKAAMDARNKYLSTNIAALSSGSTALGRAGASAQRFFTGETSAAAGKRNIANLEAGKSALEAVKSRMSSEMVKKNWTWGKSGFTTTDADGNELDMMANYKSFMATKNAAASEGKDSFEYTFKVADKDGNMHDVTKTISMMEANMQEGFILKNNESDYVSKNVQYAHDTDFWKGVGESGADRLLLNAITDAEAKNPEVKVKDRGSITDNIDNAEMAIRDAKRANIKAEQNDRFSGSNK